MNKKTICISLALMSATFFFGQNEDRKAVNAYQKAKKESLPLIEEGTKARNKLILDSIVYDLELTQQGSFEFHLVSYMNSSEKVKNAYHLQQATALSPEDPNLIGEAIEYYGMLGDEASISKMTTKLRKYGLYRKYDTYYSDVNLLMKNHDILFTNGESDTRPLLMNRSESKSDYEIIRIAWLSDPLYLIDLRSRGIICPELYDSPSDFIRNVDIQNPYRRVILSPTLNPELLSKFDSELMANGLGLVIGNDLPSDLTSDYEKIRPRLMGSDSIIKSAVGMNYLPLLRAARLSYLQNNDQEKASEIAGVIRQILNFKGLQNLEEQLLK